MLALVALVAVSFKSAISRQLLARLVSDQSQSLPVFCAVLKKHLMTDSSWRYSEL